MFYVAPEVKERFESLSDNLKEMIMEKDVELNSVHDLINVLNEIVKDAESKQSKEMAGSK